MESLLHLACMIRHLRIRTLSYSLALAALPGAALPTTQVVYVVASEVESFQQLVQLYEHDFKKLPLSLDELFRPYLKSPPKDRWGNDFVYKVTGDQPGYLLYSKGKNGIDENGDGDDITGWKKRYTCNDYGVNCGPSLGALSMIASLALLAVSFPFLRALRRKTKRGATLP